MLDPASRTEPVTAIARTDDGTYKKGVSGNPAGRPKGKKNELTELKQDLEIAVRKSLPLSRIVAIVEAVANRAEEGDMRAAKLILDKVISNASGTEDSEEKTAGGIIIQIKNATFASRDDISTPTTPLEGEFTEVKN